LATYGVPTQVAAEIDSELEQAGSVSVFGQVAKAFRINNSKKFPVFLTPSWLVQFRELGARVVRLNGVIRYYKKTLTIEAATIVADQWFSVVVMEHCGREVEFHQSEKEVDRLMTALAILLPHIPNGSDLNQALSRFFRD
jgi:hypothetical protein